MKSLKINISQFSASLTDFLSLLKDGQRQHAISGLISISFYKAFYPTAIKKKKLDYFVRGLSLIPPKCLAVEDED